MRLSERRLVAWEDSLGSVFLLANPSVSPVSLSNATGMFEYSGQEMCSARPLFFCMLRYYFPEHFTLYTRGGKKGKNKHTYIRTKTPR